MIDKRILEFILVDQKEDIENRAYEELCFREEVKLVDLSSPQAQVVIGVRRSGKSTLCYQSLTKTRAKFAYVDFDALITYFLMKYKMLKDGIYL